MNWSTIFELVKVNILYSNATALASLRKKQKKRPKAHFSIAKAMIRQQVLGIILVTVIYSFLFWGIDYSQHTALFSLQIAVLTALTVLTGFSTMYSIFFDSDDIKRYVYLPVKPSELFVAKLIASLGMTLAYLIPILLLFIVAYWQITANIWSLLLAVLNFLLLASASISLSVILTQGMGSLIFRSRHRKRISSIMTAVVTIGSLIPLMYLNFTMGERTGAGLAGAKHISQGVEGLPYFKGFLSILVTPFSLESLLHYWLGLLVSALLLALIVSYIMPRYYHNSLYQLPKNASKKKVKQARERSLKKALCYHHFATLGHAPLIIQTYVLPMIIIISGLFPLLNNGVNPSLLSNQFVGFFFVMGLFMGAIMISPQSFLGVAISLERNNYLFLRSLPLNFKVFIKGKFWTVLAVQILPVMLLVVGAAVTLGLSVWLVLMLLLGMSLSAVLQGQYIYARDYRLLDLNWQDVTQLLTRGSSQWLTFIIMLVELIVGIGVMIAIVFLTMSLPILANALIFVLSLIVFFVLQWWLYKRFWRLIS
ncbi:ABC transporter permease [Streptococcus sp. zg-JUN1979]|uniref:ABC transporter permease n=1 Tax=Streptococcus sp. zg-JUN1979 TaxID=3391450 RepID=UPI0039A54498